MRPIQHSHSRAARKSLPESSSQGQQQRNTEHCSRKTHRRPLHMPVKKKSQHVLMDSGIGGVSTTHTCPRHVAAYIPSLHPQDRLNQEHIGSWHTLSSTHSPIRSKMSTDRSELHDLPPYHSTRTTQYLSTALVSTPAQRSLITNIM